MKLFVFHHCPFCIKAMMAAGYKHLDIDWVFLQNHDVDARIEKVGANMVPILEKPDGSYMAESLDIVRYLDEFNGPATIGESTCGDQVSAWLKANNSNMSPLLYPRWLKVNLPEFQCEAAIAWFTKNKTALINMDFAQALAKTNAFIPKVNEALTQLTWLTLPSERHHQLTYDDINLYPFLRNLTVVKGLVFPDHVKRYINEVTALTGIPVYFDMAV